MLACLIISRNLDSFMELLKLVQRKLLKISVFSVTNFIGISQLCDALFTSSFKIFSFSICFWSTSIKLKLSISLHLFWIAIMLEWFLYFKVAFKVASLVLLTKGSSFEYLEISRFFTILGKKLFNDTHWEKLCLTQVSTEWLLGCFWHFYILLIFYITC